MHWRQRLVQIGLAGGLLAQACGDNPSDAPRPDGSSPAPGAGRCNGNPDPCCVNPESPACLAQNRMPDAGADAAADAMLLDAQPDIANEIGVDASSGDQ